MTDSQKAMFGCNRKTTYGWEVGDYKLDRCPVSSITDNRIFNYIRVYNRFKLGFSPEDGGWMNWPCKLNDVIDIMEREMNKIEQLRQKDREKR